MFIMILNDGETYTNLEGCKLAWVSGDIDFDEDVDVVDALVKAVATDPLHDPNKIAIVRVFEDKPERADFYAK